MDYAAIVEGIGRKARAASRSLAGMSRAQKDAALLGMADALERDAETLKTANEKDMEDGKRAGLSSAMLDRLCLTDKRIGEMAEGLRTVATLQDPVGEVIDGWVTKHGLRINKVRVPLGVVCIIYESRPNVTADAAGLCLKSGNACILRGGKEALRSNLAIGACLSAALAKVGLPESAIQVIDTPDRKLVQALLRADKYIDVVIPRGGEGLIRAVAEQSTIPVIKHYKGVCHVFIDESADETMALSITMNAKTQRPGVCNAIETLLVHEKIAPRILPKLARKLQNAGVELRGCPRTREILSDIAEATEEDWYEEYLDLILAVRIVASVQEAIDHINTYGSMHSDAIVTRDYQAARRFTEGVDSATVYVNASTRFTDGGQFGMGAEIGISTDKLHARGPMSLPELTTYKYVILGDGQIRT